MCPARGETPTSTTRERMNGRRSSNCVTLVPHTLESEYRLREALPREISPIVSWVLYATLAMTGLKKANPSRTGWSGSNSRSTEFGSLKWIQTQVESRELTVGQPPVYSHPTVVRVARTVKAQIEDEVASGLAI